MNREERNMMADMLSIVLNVYEYNDCACNKHYAQLTYDIATSHEGCISYNEVEAVCDYIGANHTDSQFDCWGTLTLNEKIDWLKSEIDKLKNDLSYEPKTIEVIESNSMTMVELLDILFDEYTSNDEKESTYNNVKLYAVLTNMLVNGLICYSEYKSLEYYLDNHIPDWFTLVENDDDCRKKIIAWLNQSMSTILSVIKKK